MSFHLMTNVVVAVAFLALGTLEGGVDAWRRAYSCISSSPHAGAAPRLGSGSRGAGARRVVSSSPSRYEDSRTWTRFVVDGNERTKT